MGPARSLTPGIAGLPLPMANPQKGPSPALLASRKRFFFLPRFGSSVGLVAAVGARAWFPARPASEPAHTRAVMPLYHPTPVRAAHNERPAHGHHNCKNTVFQTTNFLRLVQTFFRQPAGNLPAARRQLPVVRGSLRAEVGVAAGPV